MTTTTPAPIWPTIAARVPPDLRARVTAEATTRGVDLSTILREALERHLTPQPLATLDRQPALSHTNGPATEKDAAALAWPTIGTKRWQLLEAIRAAGARGMTSDEAVLAIGYSGQRRLHDLKRAGWVRPLEYLDDQGTVRTRRRPTRRGAPADVYVLTVTAAMRLASE